MHKLRLIYHPDDHSLNFQFQHVRPIIEKYFSLASITEITVQKSDILVASYQTTEHPTPWYRPYQINGCKLIIDHLFDSDVDTASRMVDEALEIRNGSWMWYGEALRYASVGYDQYRPNRNIDRTFLLLMNKQRNHRDRIVQDLKHLLPDALYSYVDRGILLQDHNTHDSTENALYWIWHFNASWYDRTAFSVVAESWMRTDNWVKRGWPDYKTEVSEKIYKPLAYQHPLIVYGSVDTLTYLKTNGFETFDNLWDETYDSVVGDNARFEAVTKTVNQAVEQYGSGKFDAVTAEKLKHNADRFWNMDLVQQRFEQEIVADIMNFI